MSQAGYRFYPVKEVAARTLTNKTLTSHSYSESGDGNVYTYDNNLAVQFGDVNGDSKDDLVILKRAGFDNYTEGIDEETFDEVRIYEITETYYVYLSVEDQSGNRKFEDDPSIEYTGPSEDSIKNVILDPLYNGDVTPGKYVSELGFNEWRFELVDFNGDGRQDILRHTSDGFQFQLFRSMGDDFDKVSEPSGIGGVDDETYENGVALPVDYRYFLDANSDGMADLFFADGDQDNDLQKVRLYLSDGQGYDVSSPLSLTVGAFITDDPLTSAPESVIFPGDFNGDGVVDFAYAYKIPATNLGIIKTWLFSGTNWVSGGQTNQFTWRDDGDFMGIDSNGDGRTDLVHIYKDSSQEKLTLWKSLGDSFASPTTPQTIDTWRDERRYHQVDLDGDGKGDLARLTKNSSNLEAAYWTSNGLVPDLLTGVTDGLGAKSVVEYKALSDDIVHEDSSSSLAYPNVPYVGGLHVVHKLGKDNGVGVAAGDYVTQYWYSGGSLHVWGRGFLGFRVFKSEDLDMGKVRIETANIQFPYIGMSQIVENYMPDPLTTNVELVSRTVNQLDSYTTKTKTFTEEVSVTRSHKSWFPYYSESKKEKKEVSDETGIAASYFSAVLTTNNYRDTGGNGDLYGNPREVTLDYFDYSVSTTIPRVTEKTENTQWLNIETIDDWMPGRLKTSQVTYTRVGETSKTRTSEFIYAHPGDTNYTGTSTHGMLHKEISEPNDAQHKIETTYTYDSKGNILEKKVDAADIDYNGGNPVTSTKTIKSVYTYTTDGRFIKEEKTQGASSDSTIDQIVTRESFKQGFALPTAIRDINNLKTEIDYDAFGRTTRTRSYGKTLGDADYLVSEATIDYLFSDTGAPSLTAMAIKSETLSASLDIIVPEATTFVDRLGRTLRTKSKNADGETVYADTEYDDYGRVLSTSEPYFPGGPTYLTTNTYDAVGRLKLVTQDVEDPTDPDSSVKQTIQTKYLYAGLEHTIISDFDGTNPQSTKKTTNVKGEVVRVDQEESAYMLYYYDAFGNLRQVRDSQGNDTVISYDAKGRFKVSMTDPDMGTWTYTHNSLGELKWQIDNSNAVTTIEYDFLGRMTRRQTMQSGVSTSVDTWTYDSASGRSHGKLASESGGDNYQKTYTYSDAGFGELIKERSTISGQTFDLDYEYDASRRLEKIWDPQGRYIKNIYNAYGALDRVEGWDAGGLDHTWWEATDVDHLNRIRTFDLAGGTMKGRRAFKGGSGLVSYMESGIGASTTNIMQSKYSYDHRGNVKRREMTSPRSLSETFTYDGLNRLKTWTVSGQSTQTATYDAIGNVTSRTDVGGGAMWSYDPARPHAVTAAGSNTYSYDANGNLKRRNGSSIWWLPFNKPRAIFNEESSYTFYYDNNRNRVVETIIADGRWRSRIQVGALYEEVYDDGVKSYRLSIPTPMGIAGVWTVGDEGEFRTYNHNDLLGSVGIITNENGVVQEEYAYDPWGAPRNPINWSSLSNWPDYKDDRGYTGHQMLEGLELVHMNGRIYDPAIGRFLSADPFIQFSGDSQSYNRYAYVLNNPMRYSDPSGHFVEFLVPVAKWIADYAILAGAIYGGISGYQEGGLKGAFYGAAFGAISGAISSGIGGIFEATAWGRMPLGQATVHELSRAMAHGISMGGLSEAVGGDFGSGFAGGFFGSFAGHGAEGLGYSPQTNFFAAVAIGGTAAEIGGGKFANGALSAAFTYMVNQAANQPAQGKQPIPENALKFQVGGRYRTIRGGDPVSFGGSLGDTFADMGTDFATALEPMRGPLTITTGVGTTAAGILLTETVGFAWAGVPLTLLGTTQVGLGLSETADYFFGGNAFNTPTGSFELIGEMTGNPTYRTYGSWVDLGVSFSAPPKWAFPVDVTNYLIGIGAEPGGGNGP
jgi:RHS repeat-associated protein